MVNENEKVALFVDRARGALNARDKEGSGPLAIQNRPGKHTP